MPVTLHIPDSIASGLRLPEKEIETRLRMELALALYQQEILSFGKSVELAGVNRHQFGELLRTANCSALRTGGTVRGCRLCA